MLFSYYLLVNFGFDTAENESSKVWPVSTPTLDQAPVRVGRAQAALGQLWIYHTIKEYRAAAAGVVVSSSTCFFFAHIRRYFSEY